VTRISTLEYEHTWPTAWEIWGRDAGKPTGQRFLLDVHDVQDHAHALTIARADARPGFGTILHSVTPRPDGYVSKGFRRKATP